MADPKSKIGSNAKPGRNWLKFLFRAGILLLLLVVVAWLLIGAAGAVGLRRLRLVATLLFPLSALCSLLLLVVAFDAAFSVPEAD